MMNSLRFFIFNIIKGKIYMELEVTATELLISFQKAPLAPEH